MPNWQSGVGGAAAGAGAGAAIGSVVPVIGTGIGAGAGALLGGLTGFFGGGDDDAIQQQIQLWKDTLAKLQNDPTEASALQQLQALTTTGLTDQERAEEMQAAMGASQLARGREGAIANTAAMRGGGVSTSGMTAANQDVNDQGAEQQYAVTAQQAAGQASQRRTQAIEAYNQELDRRQQLIQAATSGLSGAYGSDQNYNEAQAEALMQNLGAGASTAVAGLKLGQTPGAGAAVPTNSQITGATSVNPSGWAFSTPTPSDGGFTAYPNKPGFGTLSNYFGTP